MRSCRATSTTGGALALVGMLAVPMAAAGDKDEAGEKEMSRAAVKRLVERALPRWNPDVLDVPDGKRWVEETRFDGILAALGDQPPSPDLPDGARQLRDERRTLRLDVAKGKIRYVSRERAWTFERDFPKPAFDARGSLRRVLETLRVLGAPVEEAGAPRIETQVAAGARAGARGATDNFQMYRLVLFSRRVGNLPVYGSGIQAAVSHQGQIQRLQVNWPSFALASRLRLRSRMPVVDDAVQQIMNQQPGPGTRLRASLVYAPEEDANKALRYVPSVLIAVSSPPTPYLVLVPVAQAEEDDES